ncbi:HD domain-containing protein [Amycolatopsis kentuckyensis]|uniref:HD domain-containing protein n=1 Tax=Amycolatopsis kentuckyensis TaxID=218823 RepID=UPI000A380EE8|nr:ATP-binding protein [Amycolatopsis kentuckyensis]
MGLWQILEDGEDVRFTADVKHLVGYAAGKLLLVRETFPDYTLHDRQHADNVIKLIEELLGQDIVKLTPLEAGMLILAAYLHDIGMVYTREEVDALLEEQDFRDYLDQHPSAYVRVAQEGKPPEDVILDYCRARHADRVSEHLYQLDPEKLAWRGLNFAEALATVCKSHNEPLDELRAERFATDFLAGCDLRLCAILLRTADLLDFDQSRSPVAVYEHLRLEEAEGSRRISRTEWEKHMASIGFVFPHDRTPGYSVKLIARPQQPAVENAIRRFLDVVDDELRGCRVVLDFCAPRWRSLILPATVDRRDIVSQGYRWGDYRFILDRHAILQLFMGDRLYANSYVFIRELLQNAIDACRLNAYLQDLDPDEMEVRISAWEDEFGNYWLRIDDNGVGMDQHIIEKYFLGVGRSYYSSDELKAEILRKQKPQRNFVSISRFGIGVLSSFIVGDRIEVSTRRRLPNGRLAGAIRLSLHSLDDFFVLREPPMQAETFPARAGGESGYRKGSGTSIAVRINPAKSDVSLEELLEYAENSLFYPPGKVYINDVEWADRKFADLAKPLFDGPTRYIVPDSAAHDKGLASTSTVIVTALPLDLTANSPSEHVRGQIVALAASAEPKEGSPGGLLGLISKDVADGLSAEFVSRLAASEVERSASVSLSGEDWIDISLCLEFGRGILRELQHEVAKKLDSSGSFDNLLRAIGRYEKEWPERRDDTVRFEVEYSLPVKDVIGGVAARRLAKGWLGHNGVRVTTVMEEDGFPLQGELTFAPPTMIGHVCLSDDLRPDVTVSRESIRAISFDICSAIQLAVRRAAAQHLGVGCDDCAQKAMGSPVFPELSYGGTAVRDIDADVLADEWIKEEIVHLPSMGMVSIRQLRDIVKDSRVELRVSLTRWGDDFGGRARNFYTMLILAMLEREFSVELLRVDGTYYPHYYVISVRPLNCARPSGSSLMPPFAGVGYDSARTVIRSMYPANIANPLVMWFFENAVELYRDYPALFVQFRRALDNVANREGGFAGLKEGVKLMNAVMDRIRRTFSDLPPALYQEVYLSEGKELVQDI